MAHQNTAHEARGLAYRSVVRQPAVKQPKYFLLNNIRGMVVRTSCPDAGGCSSAASGSSTEYELPCGTCSMKWTGSLGSSTAGCKLEVWLASAGPDRSDRASNGCVGMVAA